MDSMLSLKAIDHELFILLDNTFIKLFSQTNIKDIRYYISHRNQILMKMMNMMRDRPGKVQAAKKEHI